MRPPKSIEPGLYVLYFLRAAGLNQPLVLLTFVRGAYDDRVSDRLTYEFNAYRSRSAAVPELRRPGCSFMVRATDSIEFRANFSPALKATRV